MEDTVTSYAVWREALRRIWPPGSLVQGPLERSPRLLEMPITWKLSGCSGEHPPAHTVNVAGASAGMPEVAFLITLTLPGRDETALCFKEHPQPYQQEMRYPNYGRTGENPGRISQHRKVNKKYNNGPLTLISCVR